MTIARSRQKVGTPTSSQQMMDSPAITASRISPSNRKSGTPTLLHQQ